MNGPLLRVDELTPVVLGWCKNCGKRLEYEVESRKFNEGWFHSSTGSTWCNVNNMNSFIDAEPIPDGVALVREER